MLTIKKVREGLEILSKRCDEQAARISVDDCWLIAHGPEDLGACDENAIRDRGWDWDEVYKGWVIYLGV